MSDIIYSIIKLSTISAFSLLKVSICQLRCYQCSGSAIHYTLSSSWIIKVQLPTSHSSWVVKLRDLLFYHLCWIVYVSRLERFISWLDSLVYLFWWDSLLLWLSFFTLSLSARLPSSDSSPGSSFTFARSALNPSWIQQGGCQFIMRNDVATTKVRN